MKPIYLIVSVLIPFLAYSQCNRSEVVSNYNTTYLFSSVSVDELAWNGNVETCHSGSVSLSSLQKTLVRVNYFRGLVGLPQNITFNNELNAKCQEAALMMHANNSLNHYPPENWSCWTADGYDAASHSNLAMGTHSSSSITAYMRDNGSGNYAVGHRRWILYSRASEFGSGSTSNYNALYVISTNVTAPDDLSFIAYPSPGFFPQPLVFDRWSFSIPGADFSSAVVQMQTQSGLPITLSIEELANGYGDNTIVWVPELSLTSSGDETVTVNISNVGNATQSEYEYQVTVMNDLNGSELAHPPTCPENTIWSEALCTCVGESTESWNCTNNNCDMSSDGKGEFLSQQECQAVCGTSSSIDLFDKTDKTLLKIVNILGQETPFRYNTPLFYIYNDGLVEKKMISK